ncbi:MAG: hypothetical protein LBF00_02815, partial [Mycoplasmataceae bacterium]|nr:hypothetical protein [Mycoplasmataceae bacterium]
MNGLNKYKVTEWKEISGSGNWKAFKVKYANKEVANIFRQHAIYNFLKIFQVNWKQIISKKLLPDDSIFVLKDNVFYVIEIKFQNIAGSVDEKIQTCDFKKKQWTK